MKKLLTILPENIVGRMIVSYLSEGFKSCGIKTETVDILTTNINKIHLKQEDYSYIVGYGYSAIKFKKELGLELPAISYFSDIIKTTRLKSKAQKLFDELKKENNNVFYWDRVLAERLKKDINNVHYMPLFVNTSIYKNFNYKPKSDIIFAGNLTLPNRISTILDIKEEFPKIKIALFSYPEHLMESIKYLNRRSKKIITSSYKGFLVDESSMAREINYSKMVLNFTTQGISHLNLRVYEALACEKLLLTDFRMELKELFSPGEDILYYQDKEDLFNLINSYLTAPGEYADIIKAGRDTVESKYSCKVAAKNILDIVESN